MNKEEAIKQIKLSKNTFLIGAKQTIVNIESIDTVLNYIEELEKEKQQVLDDYQELGKDLANNFVSKDDIRDKIEELNKKRKYCSSDEMREYHHQIEILEELLGE